MSGRAGSRNCMVTDRPVLCSFLPMLCVCVCPLSLFSSFKMASTTKGNRNRQRRRRPLAAATCVLCTSILGQSLPEGKACFVPTPLPNQVSPRPLPTHAEFHRRFRRVHAMSVTGEQEDPIASTINMEGLSDAEVLLACRSYLSKRKKIEWSAAERRKRARKQSAQYTAGESGTVGYFWENPEELVYLKAGAGEKRGGGTGIGGGANDRFLPGAEDDRADESGSLAMAFDGGDLWSDGVVEDDEDTTTSGKSDDDNFISGADRLEHSVLGGYLSGPSDEHTRRSKAQKAKWDDPEWKEKWYKRRWGEKGEKMKSDDEKKQKKMENMVNAIPPDVLASPELVEMSDEDIAEAVKIYLDSRNKRSETNATKKKEKAASKNNATKLQNKDDKSDESALHVASIDFSLSDDDVARAKQRERSRTAKRAYQTRRANAEKRQRESQEDGANEVVKPIMPSMLSHVYAAQEAQARIEWALYANMPLDNADIDIFMVPAKMRGRKQVLLRVLKERFGKEGKCIPREDGRMVFATTTPIGKLAAYIQTLVIDEQWGGR